MSIYAVRITAYVSAKNSDQAVERAISLETYAFELESVWGFGQTDPYLQDLIELGRTEHHYLDPCYTMALNEDVFTASMWEDYKKRQEE